MKGEGRCVRGEVRGESPHLREQAVAEALEERGAAREDNVLEENLAQVHVRLLDRVDQDLGERMRA